MRVYEAKFTYDNPDMNAASISTATVTIKDGTVFISGSCVRRDKDENSEVRYREQYTACQTDIENVGWHEDGETITLYDCVYWDREREDFAPAGTHTLRILREVPLGKPAPKHKFQL